MALTWMSNRARSAAMPLVSIARPPLVAEYGAMVWRARRDCTEPMFTTLPEPRSAIPRRSEEHTSELQSRGHLVCRLLLEKKKKHDMQKLHRTEHLNRTH